MRWKKAVLIGLVLSGLFGLLLALWAVTTCFKNPVPDGLIEAGAYQEVGSNMLLSPPEREKAVKELSGEVRTAINACTKLLGQKLFYKNVSFEHHAAAKCPTVWFRDQAKFKRHLYYTAVHFPLINIYADDSSFSFFADEVSCTYDSVTHRIIGLKYPKGLNMMGRHQQYGDWEGFHEALKNRCLK